MSQIHKRPFEGNTSPKKTKIPHTTDGNLEALKLKIERMLNEYPASNKTCTQNISVLGNSSMTNKAENASLNYLTSQMQTNTLNSANLIKIPLIINRTYQNNISKPSNNSNFSKPSNLIYLTGAPAKSKTITNSDLSETDLQVLLQNFYKLKGEEQHMLISHLKKLEQDKPDLVEKLNKFVRVSSPEPETCHSEYDFNDLDDLDDILEETVQLITDAESDDDCIIVKMFKNDTGSKDEKIREIGKSAEIPVKEYWSSQKVKINFLAEQSINKETEKNSNVINNLGNKVDHIIVVEDDTTNKSPTDNKINNSKETEQTAENRNTEKISSKPKYVTNNNFVNRNQGRKGNRTKNNIQNSYKNFSDLESSSTVDQEIQAKKFGYRNYKEMKQYLEMTGIYCANHLYYSFSDNV